TRTTLATRTLPFTTPAFFRSLCAFRRGSRRYAAFRFFPVYRLAIARRKVRALQSFGQRLPLRPLFRSTSRSRALRRLRRSRFARGSFCRFVLFRFFVHTILPLPCNEKKPLGLSGQSRPF